MLAKKSDKGALDFTDREFLETELRALKEKLKEYERDANNMADERRELTGTLTKQQDDQKEIFQYLNGELAKKTDEIVALEERVLKLEEENDMQIREHESRLLSQKDAADQEIARLHKEIAEYREQLEKVSTFIEYKQTLEAQLQEKKRLLDEEAKEHATHVSDLERKHVQEKDRLKKEMLLKLRETKANLLKMTDNQLDTTTKRTIAENEQMSSELAWQSKETEKLIRKNEKLMADNQSLKRELSLHQQTEEEFARKVHVYQKTIKTLLAKLNSMDAQKRAELERAHFEEEEKEREKAEDQQQIENLEDEVGTTRQQFQQVHEELARTQSALAEVQAKHAQLLSLQDDAVKFTLQCLQDMSDELAAAPVDAFAPEGALAEPLSLQTLDPTQREQVLRYLLDQLQAYQQQLRELQLQSQWRERQQQASRESLFPPLPANASAVGADGLGQPSLGMCGGLLQGHGIGPSSGASASIGVQTGAQRSMFGSAGTGGGSSADDGVGSVVAVNGPVRPWGKRAKDMPLTRHTPSTFQRARHGHAGGAVGVR